MTNERKREIIDEVMAGVELTGAEFLHKVLVKAAAQDNPRKMREYVEVGEEFFAAFPEIAAQFIESSPTPEVLARMLDESCAGCVLNGKKTRAADKITCKRCKRVREQLKTECAKTPRKTAQDGQDDFSSTSSRKAAKCQEEPIAAAYGADSDSIPNKCAEIELFNVKDGAVYINPDWKWKHPNAEYFMADIDPKDAAKAFKDFSQDYKRVVLTFRKLIAAKGSRILYCAKSGEKASCAAVRRNGKLILLVGEPSEFGDDVLGVGVGISADF